MQNLSSSVLVKTFSLQRSQSLPGHRKSLMSSNRSAIEHLGLGGAPSRDPKGGALRQLRLDRGVDPSWLATQACISLAQLYEIETGEGELFYSVMLREQTARRIARLLNADWDTLKLRQPVPLSGHNVVHLQRTSNIGHPRRAPSLEGSDPATALTPTPQRMQPIALGLATPSAENQAAPDDRTNAPTDPQTSSPKTAGRMLFVTFVLIASMATAWFWSEPKALLTAQTLIDWVRSWMASWDWLI